MPSNSSPVEVEQATVEVINNSRSSTDRRVNALAVTSTSVTNEGAGVALPSPAPGGCPPPPLLVKCPPPPPAKGLLQQNKSVGPIPKVKMPSLNWKKVALSPNQPPNFWKGATNLLEDLKCEYEILEDLFGLKKSPPSPKGGLSSSGGDDKSSKTTVTLLDFKRVQALSIMLSRMKMSNEEIRLAIELLDGSKFNIEDLKTMQKNAPTSDEIELLKAFPDDPATLGKPEQFFLAIMDIPRFAAKLDSLIFVQKFASQEVEELKPDAETLIKACGQIKTSKKFGKMLEVILAIGNYINGGTPRVGAGFKLDSLLLLQDVRSPGDGKFSLLSYFARLLREKYPELVNFYEELSATENAKRVSLQTIATEVNNLRKSLSAAQIEAEQSKADSAVSTNILESALSRIVPQFKALEAQAKAAQDAFNEVTLFYGEDPKTTSPEDFFSIISQFNGQLNTAHKDAAAEKERMQKEAKRLASKTHQRSGSFTNLTLVLPKGNSSPETATYSPKLNSPKLPSSYLKPASPKANVTVTPFTDAKSDLLIKGNRLKHATPAQPNVPESVFQNVVLRKTGTLRA